MSTRAPFLFTLALCGALTAAVFAAAPAGDAPAAPARGGRGPGVPAGLGSAMTDLNRMLINVQKQAADPAQMEAALCDIALMQRDVAISKTLTPPTVNRIANADEKAKAIAKYRAQCNDLTKTLLELEEAVNAKKADDVKKAITKAIDLGNAAHKDYEVDAKIGS